MVMAVDINLESSVTTAEWKENLKRRIITRVARTNQLAERLIVKIEEGSVDGSFEFERERLWLENFAQEGEGLNLCCGHFAIGNSYGLDINKTIASDFIMPVDLIDRFGPNRFDFIISNHFESVNSPMSVFYAIHRVLKFKGLLALVFLNADAEANSSDTDDVMNSPKKVSFFSRSIMRRYLIKAGFIDIEITEAESPRFLRVTARKGGAWWRV
jgi:SAM-dependent methyltransferase